MARPKFYIVLLYCTRLQQISIVPLLTIWIVHDIYKDCHGSSIKEGLLVLCDSDLQGTIYSTHKQQTHPYDILVEIITMVTMDYI